MIYYLMMTILNPTIYCRMNENCSARSSQMICLMNPNFCTKEKKNLNLSLTEMICNSCLDSKKTRNFYCFLQMVCSMSRSIYIWMSCCYC